METNFIITGSILGMLAIVFGAFGAHGLRKILPEEKVNTFEIGVRYQMYAALTLLLCSQILDVTKGSSSWAFYGLTIGTLLFSFSIYLLSLKDKLNWNMKFIGPITPLGGLLMIVGWLAILMNAITNN